MTNPEIIVANSSGAQKTFMLRMEPHCNDQPISKEDFDANECHVDSGQDWPEVVWFAGMRAVADGARDWACSFRFNSDGLAARDVLLGMAKELSNG